MNGLQDMKVIGIATWASVVTAIGIFAVVSWFTACERPLETGKGPPAPTAQQLNLVHAHTISKSAFYEPITTVHKLCLDGIRYYLATIPARYSESSDAVALVRDGRECSDPWSEQ